MRGAGCMECNDSGYRGRVGIFEVLPVNADLRDVLLSHPDRGCGHQGRRCDGDGHDA